MIRIHAALYPRVQAGWRPRWPGRDACRSRRDVEGDLARQLGELDLAAPRARRRRCRSPPGPEVTRPSTSTCRKIVEVGEVRDAVAEVRADRLVDPSRAVVAARHQRLDELQLLGQRHVRPAPRCRPRGMQPAHACCEKYCAPTP